MSEFVDDVGRRLLNWIGLVVDVPIRIGAADDFDGIRVTLLRIECLHRPRDAGEALMLTLQYQLTVLLRDPFAAQRVLGELAFAAIVHPDYAFAGAEAATTPTLLLTTRLSRARTAMPAPLVRFPLRALLTERPSVTALARTGD